ncbi:hypothetical protein [Streptomyces sp. NPDC056069]|uniref:hypothetical protein n=1 Tax=Streptomyces sp. NPDC056069 TaxID=3345702 RepID=UPI0035E21729
MSDMMYEVGDKLTDKQADGAGQFGVELPLEQMLADKTSRSMRVVDRWKKVSHGTPISHGGHGSAIIRETRASR